MELFDSKSLSDHLNLRNVFFLPLTLVYKLIRTFLRTIGLAFSLFLLILTFGSSCGICDLFLRRTSILAADLADWVIYPFALLSRFVKMCFSYIRRTP